MRPTGWQRTQRSGGGSLQGTRSARPKVRGDEQSLADTLLSLQQRAGNRAVAWMVSSGALGPAAQRSPVQRKVASDGSVDDIAKLLGITGTVRAVDTPPKAKIGTPLSSYPADNMRNITPSQQALTIAHLHYADQADEILKDQEFANQPADLIVKDEMGGGAYNHTQDLVVLAGGYDRPSLMHEMGHKAQAEAGATNDTAATIVLEYHNVLSNQNIGWLTGTEPGPPRLYYDVNRARGGNRDWGAFRTAAKAKLHHQPLTETLIQAIEDLTGDGKYATPAGPGQPSPGAVARGNLAAEFFSIYK
jgi:hypothetical protein